MRSAVKADVQSNLIQNAALKDTLYLGGENKILRVFPTFFGATWVEFCTVFMYTNVY